ncbi:erv26 super protein [Coemansia guatemalensis]|uniref:Erv26 super protein n=1 Tax=Coemansia guatemalensis TaxID=2761395 RepID=A0A9W8HN29_9FUNG|nr:erv26 super protein [Coemansia guatemalensis]
MTFLGLLSAAGWVLGLIFAIFSLACGLYVVSEWVEEYPRLTRQVIHVSVWTVDVVHVLAAFDGLSVWRLAVSAAANHIYALNLARFPLVDLGSATFVGSCLLAVSNHFLFFFYFMSHLRFPFDQVCAFMFFGVWLVPLALFVSLTPVDASLPSAQAATGDRSKNRQNIFKMVFSRFGRSEERRLPQSLHAE